MKAGDEEPEDDQNQALTSAAKVQLYHSVHLSIIQSLIEWWTSAVNSQLGWRICSVLLYVLLYSSDVKRGQNLEAEATAMRPRPEPQCWGQFLEVEAEAKAKNNYEKSTK